MSELDSSPGRRTETEESGEELLDEDLVRRDYQAIPELDRYDAKELDPVEYETIGADARRAAEAAMRQRDQGSRGQGPPFTSDEESEPARVRRRISEDEGGAEDDTRRPPRTGGADDDDDDDEEFVNLDDFRGPLEEYLAMEAPRTEIKRRFRMFLREFVGDDHSPLYPRLISQMCSENKQSLEVSYLDLSKAVPILAIWVADEPAIILELFDEEAMEVTLSMFPWYRNVHNFVHVRITKLPILDRIRDLRQAMLKALIKVEGVVTRRTSVFPQLKHVRYTCGKCGSLTGIFPQTGDEVKKPVRCIECQESGNFTVNSEETIYQNYQKITLQESPGTVPAGRIPRQKDVILLHDLIDKVSPGQKVIITGVYNHNYDVALNYQNGFPVFSTQIMANHVDPQDEEESSLTDEDVAKIIKLSRAPNLGDIIFNSIAPSIHGHEVIKKALAFSLFSGEPKIVSGGGRIRGDINLLLLGDPGMGKSQFLKYAEKTAKRAIYTTGKGASAVGLTAGVRKDPVTGEWTLEGGALVLADQGVCLIDEFDKMNDADRTSIHEAMEQQTISVAKAGIVTTLKARCAVIAAANPLGGRYDSSLNFTDNVDLTDPILSRFDVLCIVRDIVDPVEDKRLADFVINSHASSHPNVQAEKASTDPMTDDWEKEGRISQAFLKKYIIYARQNCHPKLHNIDDDKIAKLYGQLRRASMDTGGIPIAVRHIESLIRMSEAHAKIHLRDVTNEDVDVAIRVMLTSFISSQKFQVKRSLEKQFQKYLNEKKDSFELLLYILNSLANEQLNLRRLQRGQRVDPTQQEPVRISKTDFEQRAAELEIFSLTSFYKSSLFSNNGFSQDRRSKVITKLYA